jgi:hypothetical protein
MFKTESGFRNTDLGIVVKIILLSTIKDLIINKQMQGTWYSESSES